MSSAQIGLGEERPGTSTNGCCDRVFPVLTKR